MTPLASVMNYVECDLDADVTLPQWRRTRSHRRHAVKRLLRVVRPQPARLA